MPTPNRILDDMIQPGNIITVTGADMGYTSAQYLAALTLTASIVDLALTVSESTSDADVYDAVHALRLQSKSFLRPLP